MSCPTTYFEKTVGGFCSASLLGIGVVLALCSCRDLTEPGLVSEAEDLFPREVQARVVDGDGEPIRFATIDVTNDAYEPPERRLRWKVATDVDGRFEVPAPIGRPFDVLINAGLQPDLPPHLLTSVFFEIEPIELEYRSVVQPGRIRFPAGFPELALETGVLILRHDIPRSQGPYPIFREAVVPLVDSEGRLGSRLPLATYDVQFFALEDAPGQPFAELDYRWRNDAFTAPSEPWDLFLDLLPLRLQLVAPQLAPPTFAVVTELEETAGSLTVRADIVQELDWSGSPLELWAPRMDVRVRLRPGPGIGFFPVDGVFGVEQFPSATLRLADFVLRVQVRDPGGRPVAGLHCELIQPGISPAELETDDGGRALFLVDAGNYLLRLALPDGGPFQESVVDLSGDLGLDLIWDPASN
jgi:hypothetical protein